MIEIPEAQSLAKQMLQTLEGRTITRAAAAVSPHGFAWYYGEPSSYNERLAGRTVVGSAAFGGQPELWAGEMRLSFSDGVNVRYLAPGDRPPPRYQLLVNFDDDSGLYCTVQMYGGMLAFADGENENPYYTVAKTKPSPLSDEFTFDYFTSLIVNNAPRLSTKLFLATQQRIPGLGNGVLQDILWKAKIHPKRTMGSLSDDELRRLHGCVKQVLTEMSEQGGRATEKDFFGQPGGHKTVMSRLTFGTPCPECGSIIRRLDYRGGTVYVCEGCQKI